MITEETLGELRARYAAPEVPKCRICGGEMSVQRAGGGGPTIWGCSGMVDDPTGERNWVHAEGRSFADEHYERSRWTDYRRGGDSEIIELIDAYTSLLTTLTAGNSPAIPDGWVKCSERLPDEHGLYLGWWSEDCRIGPVWFIKGEHQAEFQSYQITHWMTLPEPPC